jgi:hypothetical protein
MAHPGFISWQIPVVELEAAGAAVGKVSETTVMACLLAS